MGHLVQALSEQFATGGRFMWVILAALAVGCAVAIERIIYYYIYCRGNGVKIVGQVLSLISGGNLQKANELLSGRSTPLYILLRTAVNKFSADASVDRIRESVEQSAIRELPRITCRLNYLSLIANIATLLGLLGTITGLQVAFASIATVDASQKAAMLAKGISEFMNCTAFGLVVAVFCMVMFTILNNKQQSLIKDIDDSIGRFISAARESRE
jgi:biopolymer transport protein ExbB